MTFRQQGQFPPSPQKLNKNQFLKKYQNTGSTANAGSVFIQVLLNPRSRGSQLHLSVNTASNHGTEKNFLRTKDTLARTEGIHSASAKGKEGANVIYTANNILKKNAMQLLEVQDLRVPSKRVAMVSRKVFWGASNPFITGIFPAWCEILHQSLSRRMVREESAKKGEGERDDGGEGGLVWP